MKIDPTTLTLQQKIGQLLMVGFDASEPDDHIIELIKTYKAGNVILFARNIESPNQLIELTSRLQQLAMEEIGIPLFISVDQEGGMVTRIKHGATFFPGAMTLGATGNPDLAFETGQHMGDELHQMGINMNLAPCLDVNNNPYNPVIGVRSYSDNPDTVSAFGTAFISGLQEHVIATAKHFPGHGDTKVDSHLALPTIDIDQARFETVELVPFKAAIEQGVKAIMSSHINFPLINEAGRPTTLSYNALTKLLRHQLGFQGLIVTDCMEMKAIQRQYTTPIGSKMAIEAGADLLCISHTKALQIASYEALLNAVQRGELDEEVIDDRVQRILSFKDSLSIPKPDQRPVFQPNLAYQQHALDVVKAAITLVKGEEIDRSKRTILLSGNPIATSIADETNGSLDIVQAIQESNLKIDAKRIGVRIDEEMSRAVLELVKGYEQVIYCSYNANIHPSQITFMDALTTQQPNTHVYSMRNPYDIVFSTTVRNVMNFYEYTPNGIQALLMYLNGDIRPMGKAPVTYE